MLKFASKKEAIQHLSNLTGNRIKIAIDESLSFLYEAAKETKNIEVAVDAIEYFIFGKKSSDNPFHEGFYKLRYTDDKTMDDKIHVLTSQYLLNLENKINLALKEKDKKVISEILVDTQNQIDNLINEEEGIKTAEITSLKESGLQEIMNHHYNEIKRLQKGKDLSSYDEEHKDELIAFLDAEMKKFKDFLRDK